MKTVFLSLVVAAMIGVEAKASPNVDVETRSLEELYAEALAQGGKFVL